MGGSEIANRRRAWLRCIAADAALPGLAVRVAILLEAHFNSVTAEAWPALATLARMAGATERGTQKAIASLVERGHLSVVRGGGRSATNRFRMAFANGEQLFGVSPENPEQPFAFSEVETPNNCSENPEQPFAKTPNSRSPEPRKKNTGVNLGREGISPPITEDQREGGSHSPATATPRRKSFYPSSGDDPAFGRFWQVYPRRIARGAAERAWRGAIRSGGDPASIIAAAERFSARRLAEEPDPAQRERFTPHPASWLNARRWQDEPPASDAVTLDGLTGEVIHPAFERAHEHRGRSARRGPSAFEILNADGSAFAGHHED